MLEKIIMLIKKRKSFIRFACVGVLNTCVDFGVFTLLNRLLMVNYMLSQAAGFIAGIINSFIFNKRWTFKEANTQSKTITQFMQFVVVNGMSLLISLLGMKIMVDTIGWHVMISKVAVTFIIQLVNYFGYKLWVFKAKN